MKKTSCVRFLIVIAGCMVCSTQECQAATAQLKAAMELDSAAQRAAREQVRVNRPPPPEYSMTETRDPFDSLITQQADKSPVVAKEVEVKPPPFTVQGVVWGGEQPQAIMENQVVRVGDMLKEAKITAITRQGIKFMYMEREFSIAAPAAQGTDKKDQP